MADLAKLLVRIEADNSKLRSELVKSTKQLQRFEQKTSKTVASVGRSLKRLTAGFVGFEAFRSAGNIIVDFDSKLADIRAATGATGKDLESLSKFAIDLGGSTAFSASQAADGIEILAKAGRNQKEIFESLPPVLDLASAGTLSIADAASIATTTLNQFGESADQSKRVSDVLAKAANLANTTVAELGVAFNKGGSIASSFGESIESTAASFVLLAEKGIVAERAGTGYQSLQAALGKAATAPTSTQAEILTELKVGLDEINPAANDLEEIMRRLTSANIDTTQTLALVGREAFPVADALLELSGRAEEVEVSLKKAPVENFASEVAKKKIDDLSGSFEELGGAVESVILQISDKSGLKEGTKNFIGFLTEGIRALTDELPGTGEGEGLGLDLDFGKFFGELDSEFAKVNKTFMKAEKGLLDDIASADTFFGIDINPYKEKWAKFWGIPAEEQKSAETIDDQLGTLGKLAEENPLGKAVTGGTLLDNAGMLTTKTQETTVAVQAQGDALDANNEKLQAAVELTAKQKQTFEELVKSTKESINAPEANPLTEGTPIEALRAIDEAASLSSAGDKEGSIKAASRALELTKALSESGTISDQYANQLVDRAAELGGESLGQQPVQVGIDQEFMRANAITAYNIVQEKFYEPLKLAFAADNPTAAATPQLPQGATKPDGSPVYIQVGDKEYEIEGKGPGMDKIRAEFARQNAKWAAK